MAIRTSFHSCLALSESKRILLYQGSRFFFVCRQQRSPQPAFSNNDANSSIDRKSWIVLDTEARTDWENDGRTSFKSGVQVGKVLTPTLEAPVIFNYREVFKVRSGFRGLNPQIRADETSKRIQNVAEDYTIPVESIEPVDGDFWTEIGSSGRPIIFLFNIDAEGTGKTRQEIAKNWSLAIRNALLSIVKSTVESKLCVDRYLPYWQPSFSFWLLSPFLRSMEKS
jgi:hypothetical protein